MKINIVLVEPEIPQNTGNIARTCAATGAALHLVGPLGFSIDDRYLKRAGLDYWKYVDLQYYNGLQEFFDLNEGAHFLFCTTKAQKSYHEINYTDKCFILFGKETKGLPETLLKANYEKCLRIPMLDNIRSLNLSNSVAIILYEALRQKGFKNLQLKGHLHEEEL
ncbi:MAG TPA: tRNA (uridine(34)/cytosine(34)/5-carboxymethylaminomethyluridine(34)-2'-O)-methyltransferase TrmL [Clostridiaceae bacterium]|nr:tRNA (uridine(34)/cytosine(34)/5-carboxymethylaminomethyluridine(34)-2'-O)-methyltransferase TrmL [Clostridiaceae bacterium]